ncbi:MAG: F0F1 ATP synthase subunit epsilon [Mediterranea sp.]|jgi:F-type H+-transporting ATPase subunit epsilon|nr:F0F1 ATP synthase subunit epsilon [Mediterranea sp.]
MTTKALRVSIVSPEKVLFDGEVRQVTLPGTMGVFSILPQHAPIVSSLKAGTVSYVTAADGEERSLEVRGGFVEESANVVSVCVVVQAKP